MITIEMFGFGLTMVGFLVLGIWGSIKNAHSAGFWIGAFYIVFGVVVGFT